MTTRLAQYRAARRDLLARIAEHVRYAVAFEMTGTTMGDYFERRHTTHANLARHALGELRTAFADVLKPRPVMAPMPCQQQQADAGRFADDVHAEAAGWLAYVAAHAETAPTVAGFDAAVTEAVDTLLRRHAISPRAATCLLTFFDAPRGPVVAAIIPPAVVMVPMSVQQQQGRDMRANAGSSSVLVVKAFTLRNEREVRDGWDVLVSGQWHDRFRRKADAIECATKIQTEIATSTAPSRVPSMEECIAATIPGHPVNIEWEARARAREDAPAMVPQPVQQQQGRDMRPATEYYRRQQARAHSPATALAALNRIIDASFANRPGVASSLARWYERHAPNACDETLAAANALRDELAASRGSSRNTMAGL